MQTLLSLAVYLASTSVASSGPVALAATFAPGSGSAKSGSKGKRPSDNEVRARESYERGRILFQAQEYEDAISAFQEAAALYASPDFQYNLALCYERLKIYSEAIVHYRAYKATAPASADIAEIDSRISALEDLRKRQIAAQEEAAEAERIAQEKRAKEQAEAQLASDDQSGAAKLGEDAAPVDPTRGPKRMRKAGVGLLAGGAAIAAASGVGFGLAVHASNQELEAIQEGGNPMDASFADAEAIAQDAKRQQAFEFIGIGVGAAIAVTGAVLVGVGSAKLKASRQLSFSPSLSPRNLGVRLQGRF